MSNALSIGWFGPANEQWEWILSHFGDVVLLRKQDTHDWFASRTEKTSSRSALLIASDSRFDEYVEFAKDWERDCQPNLTNANVVPMGVVLGEDWCGHRRTNPLPELWNCFYWYELYDRLLPWLAGHQEPVESSSLVGATSSHSKRKVGPRVQRCIDDAKSLEIRNEGCLQMLDQGETALVVTESATIRQLWFDAFGRLGLPVVATSPSRLDLWIHPTIIVLDLDALPLASATEHLEFRLEIVVDLAKRFPSASLVVTDPFPRWEKWKVHLDAGANILIPKPFQFLGALNTLLRK